MNKFKLFIVSAEKEIFFGDAVRLYASGSSGDFEILPGHTHFLTSLKPGPVFFSKVDESGKIVEEFLFISGGFLEVLPDEVTVLADTAIRAKDIDEQATKAAQKMAEDALSGSSGKFDYAAANQQLAIALAQLRIIRKLKEGK